MVVMRDLADRSASNPLLGPGDVAPSRPGLRVICVLNPGAFTYHDKAWLELRIAEALPPRDDLVSAIVLDPSAVDGINRLEVRTDDAALESGDPRRFRYQGRAYFTTLAAGCRQPGQGVGKIAGAHHASHLRSMSEVASMGMLCLPVARHRQRRSSDPVLRRGRHHRLRRHLFDPVDRERAGVTC